MSTRCRLCGHDDLISVLDLGATPPCERFLTAAMLDEAEETYPLHLRLCPECLLLQIPALISPQDTFSDYAYYSSFSTSWVEHARQFVESATAGFGPDKFVVEVASNDGYLLQHCVAKGLRCLGIEPSDTGNEARKKGVPTLTAFLDADLGARVRAAHGPADLVVANNVWAHIPDIVGFTRGLRHLVADDGQVAIEVHHALQLIRDAQFDTIYHEHFQYWTVLAAQRGLEAGGLRLVRVEQLPTHGGSIRLWARPFEFADEIGPSVDEVLAQERAAHLDTPEGYAGLAEKVALLRRDFTRFLIEAKDQGKRVVAYGAPGKANTLLNFCGIRRDLLEFCVDRNPYKHGRYTPGTRIPIYAPEALDAARPDYVVILPWNLRDEIVAQLEDVQSWGGRLVLAQPHLEVVGS